MFDYCVSISSFSRSVLFVREVCRTAERITESGEAHRTFITHDQAGEYIVFSPTYCWLGLVIRELALISLCWEQFDDLDFVMSKMSENPQGLVPCSNEIPISLWSKCKMMLCNLCRVCYSLILAN